MKKGRQPDIKKYRDLVPISVAFASGPGLLRPTRMLCFTPAEERHVIETFRGPGRKVDLFALEIRSRVRVAYPGDQVRKGKK